MQYKLFIIHKKYIQNHISNIMFRLNIQKSQVNKYIMYYLHCFLYLSYILILILYHHISLYVLDTVYNPMIFLKYNYHHRFYKYQDIYITHQLILFFLLYIQYILLFFHRLNKYHHIFQVLANYFQNILQRVYINHCQIHVFRNKVLNIQIFLFHYMFYKQDDMVNNQGFLDQKYLNILQSIYNYYLKFSSYLSYNLNINLLLVHYNFHKKYDIFDQVLVIQVDRLHLVNNGDNNILVQVNIYIYLQKHELQI